MIALYTLNIDSSQSCLRLYFVDYNLPLDILSTIFISQSNHKWLTIIYIRAIMDLTNVAHFFFDRIEKGLGIEFPIHLKNCLP